MTERLSDADLERVERTLAAGPQDALALVAEVRAFRAQQAPTTDEPAAWGLQDDGELFTAGAGRNARAVAEREAAKRGYSVVPLYRRPAPATDEEAVERAARVLSKGLVDDWKDVDWDTQEAYREDARAALSAAQGGGDRG